MANTKKTAKQKEFDLVLSGIIDKPYEFTKKLKITKPEDVEIIRKYKSNISWYQIATRNTLTDEFIDEFYEYLKPYLGKLCVNVNINMEFLKVNRDYIDWRDFVYRSNGNRFTIEFINEFDKELNENSLIPMLLTKKGLPKESLKYLTDDKSSTMDFHALSCQTDISLKKVEMYKDKLDWKSLSKYAICLCNPKNFETYKDRIDIYEFTSYNYRTDGKHNFIISKYFLEKYKDENINWCDFFRIYNYKLIETIEKGLDSKGLCVLDKSKNLVFDKNFFKDNYASLPKDAREAYDDFKISSSKQSAYYRKSQIPWA